MARASASSSSMCDAFPGSGCLNNWLIFREAEEAAATAVERMDDMDADADEVSDCCIDLGIRAARGSHM